MSRVVRAALTQTCNAYAAMPERVADLGRLADRLDDVREANLARHAELIAAAAAAGAGAVGLGELFAAPYFALDPPHPMWRALAEDAVEGPSVRAMRAAARAHGVVVVAPIYELDRASGRRFNTAVVLDADGEVRGKYRKAHIPSGANERAGFVETEYYEASDGRLETPGARARGHAYFPAFETAVGRIGVAICYDRHFEGVMSALARSGAEIVFSPAVTFGQKSRRMWPLEFPVDALRHRIYVGGSNRQGSEPPWNVEYFGESYFCGPDGVLPDRSARADLVIADLDLDLLARPDPSGWDLARDARPDLYR